MKAEGQFRFGETSYIAMKIKISCHIGNQEVNMIVVKEKHPG